MSKSLILGVVVIVGAALVSACGSTNGSSGGLSQDANFLDSNRNGIYDPYENQDQWEAMIGGGLLRHKQDGGGSQGRYQWIDQNGDGICDYAQSKTRWQQICRSKWIDDNGDGICDNYPGRPEHGDGFGWKGWR